MRYNLLNVVNLFLGGVSFWLKKIIHCLFVPVAGIPKQSGLEDARTANHGMLKKRLIQQHHRQNLKQQ